MNEASERVRTDKTKEPENEQDNKDSPEHNFLWLSFLSFVPRMTSALKNCRSQFRRVPIFAEISNKLLASRKEFVYKRPTTALVAGRSPLMRPTFLVYLALAAFLTGCAVEGVVVEKNSRPLPFFDSVGMDGVYKLKLRDSQGNISSQMVTPEVFAQYPSRRLFQRSAGRPAIACSNGRHPRGETPLSGQPVPADAKQRHAPAEPRNESLARPKTKHCRTTATSWEKSCACTPREEAFVKGAGTPEEETSRKNAGPSQDADSDAPVVNFSSDGPAPRRGESVRVTPHRGRCRKLRRLYRAACPKRNARPGSTSLSCDAR